MVILIKKEVKCCEDCPCHDEYHYGIGMGEVYGKECTEFI